MAKRKKRRGNGDPQLALGDFRHTKATRKNIPPAKIAAEGAVPAMPKIEYAYHPRRPPVLRFDPQGGPDKLPPLLEEAGRRPLKNDEIKALAEALRKQEPWLEWAGKRESEAMGFTVDPVALHIHERISAQAILRVAARQDVQRSLFADPEQEYNEAVQFYQHDIDWTNRLILGDSLQVMASLARREDLAGKVQMIYIDPPYGIKFASNFQGEVGNRDVKDRDQDLTREAEMVKAYRDTWHLGVHSYLTYLRDRLTVARELLAETGSIFVQIGDENVHLVRALLDGVFRPENFVNQITFVKTTGSTSTDLSAVHDVLLWYRKGPAMKYRPIFELKRPGEAGATAYKTVLLPSGETQPMSFFLDENGNLHLPEGADLIASDNYTSQSPGSRYDVPLCGRLYQAEPGYWKTDEPGMRRILRAERLLPGKTYPGYLRRVSDFCAYPLSNVWTDTLGQNQFGGKKTYVTQTALKVVQRCMLMATDPSDLVLDPTCGSGTTAYVAEQWGRRWITIDTSRVALAVARQRLLTARFDRYRVTGEGGEPNSGGIAVDPHAGFVCRKVPHVKPSDIAQNTNLDPIFARHEPILDDRLAACSAALRKVSKQARTDLEAKLVAKQKKEGKRAITDAARRRWLLPPDNRDRSKKTREQATVDLDFAGWYHWEVPFDTDPDWPKELRDAVTVYRKAWHAKMDEVSACIAANADQEELVDKPKVVSGVIRVSGPFTVEAVQPPEMSLGEAAVVEAGAGEGKFAGEPAALEETFEDAGDMAASACVDQEAKNVEAYLDQMLRLLKMDGVRFPNNKEMAFSRLERVSDSSGIHAEGRWAPKGEEDDDPESVATVGVVFGPQYGPVTAKMVEELIRPAARRYEDLVLAAFTFDGTAQAVVEEARHPKLRVHMAHIRPDVNPAMNGLLKEQPGSQLFTVFGQPRSSVKKQKDDTYVVEMEGVDIYDPVTNKVHSAGASKVAAWFIDGDYDGRTFCITQAFFPNKDAWKKLAKALDRHKAFDASVFEKLSGTESLPFPAGKYKRVAVKVIDPRGNEVMQLHPLN